MAYNRNNFLQRVKEVNEIYLEHNRRGCFTEYIYNTYIKDRFHISRTTFYTYLTIPYEKQLKKIQEQRALQLTLF